MSHCVNHSFMCAIVPASTYNAGCGYSALGPMNEMFSVPIPTFTPAVRNDAKIGPLTLISLPSTST